MCFSISTHTHTSVSSRHFSIATQNEINPKCHLLPHAFDWILSQVSFTRIFLAPSSTDEDHTRGERILVPNASKRSVSLDSTLHPGSPEHITLYKDVSHEWHTNRSKKTKGLPSPWRLDLAGLPNAILHRNTVFPFQSNAEARSLFDLYNAWSPKTLQCEWHPSN